MLRQALADADWRFVWLALGSIMVTVWLKALRWRLLFRPKSSRPPFSAAFNALMLNQFVNLVFFVRIGEVARLLYVRGNSAETRPAASQTVGTIIVEKWLELLAAALTMAGLLLLIVDLPAGIDQRATQYGIIVIVLLAVLYLLAFQTERLIQLANHLYAFLPTRWEVRLQQATIAGLEGIVLLREPRAVLVQLILSFGVMALYIATPLLLFLAFGLPYSTFDAAVLHTGIGLLIAVPSTPGKFGILEVSTLAILQFLNPNVPEAHLLSYAIVYHLTIILPPLLWGGLVALRFDWSWKTP